ncbi:patatin-like phospholipase family protein [Algoriphagus chordae]|uniref:NTE family protein n=1 Tax=Algoriphagus chordae TaxID=237019 RepID=A0A2W7R193_9BACT|nr:patatin-like phospholipase family protein [Algoriphagus chordae]PZX52000.1 NTE family protein [Algoriphagus chordae]
MLRSTTILFLFLFLSVSQLAFSQSKQTTSTKAKPAKIGLVLSGGGAKGIAHVGVIKAMEKAGIKPDYIVGTSMGAVVGGLYSLGYSADELEEIVRQIDWKLLISNRVSFKYIAFEEKEYYNRYLVEFPVVNGKIAFPSGLIQGQVLSDILHYYAWPANTYATFDDFPIPFRCVATDIRNGQPIIFDKGYLQDALRSSIAIPTVFSAFDLDSTSVVDGGVVNNFPVDIVREMGADIVIGVNVSDEDFREVDDLGGFTGILMQIAMAPSLTITKENIKQTDIYIKPDLEDYSTGSFSSYNEILALGAKTGEKYYDQFKQLADSLGRNDIISGLTFQSDSIQIDEIDIVGNKLFSTDLIRSKLNVEEGDYVNRDEMEAAVHGIYGMNGFYRVDYSLNKMPSNNYSLLVRNKEKPSTLLSAAIHYDNQFSAGILLNLTAREVIGRNSRAVFLADISENPKFRFDYYKYTGTKKNYAFNLRLNFLRQEIPTYLEGKEDEIQIGRNSRLEAQMISTNSLKHAFYFGGIFDTNVSKFKLLSTSLDGIKNGRQTYVGARFKYYRNSQNDRNYPTAGAEALIEGTFHFKDWIGINLKSGIDTIFLDTDIGPIPVTKDEFNSFIDDLVPNPYVSIYGKYSKYLRFSPKFQFHPDFAMGYTLTTESDSKVFTDFFVGGYQNVRFNDTRFWGLNYGEVQTPNFVKLGAEFQYIPFSKIYLRAGANFLGYSDQVPINDPDFLKNIYQEESYLGYGLDISYQSILGPISAGISGNNQDNSLRSYISIGFSFNYSDR